MPISSQISLGMSAEIVARLEPIDETTENSSFASFKEKLKVAIQKKDSSFIKKILSDNVEYSFGADPERKSAVEGFLRYYKIEDKKESAFWKSLRDVLDLGCTKSGEEFTCPYVYSKWPDKYDSFSFVAAIRDKIPIRKKPESSAEVLRFANFEIFKLSREQKTKDWNAIDLGNKQVGFVSTTDVRGPTDYRVRFQKTSDGWKLKYFITGD